MPSAAVTRWWRSTALPSGLMRIMDTRASPTATALVQRLAERGWVVRTAAVGDARVSMIRISPEGCAVLRHQRITAAEGIVPVLAEIDDETLHDLQAGLAGLKLALRQDVEQPADVPAAKGA